MQGRLQHGGSGGDCPLPSANGVRRLYVCCRIFQGHFQRRAVNLNYWDCLLLSGIGKKPNSQTEVRNSKFIGSSQTKLIFGILQFYNVT